MQQSAKEDSSGAAATAAKTVTKKTTTDTHGKDPLGRDCLECRLTGGACFSAAGAYTFYERAKLPPGAKNRPFMALVGTGKIGYRTIYLRNLSPHVIVFCFSSRSNSVNTSCSPNAKTCTLLTENIKIPCL